MIIRKIIHSENEDINCDISIKNTYIKIKLV